MTFGDDDWERSSKKLPNQVREVAPPSWRKPHMFRGNELIGRRLGCHMARPLGPLSCEVTSSKSIYGELVNDDTRTQETTYSDGKIVLDF